MLKSEILLYKKIDHSKNWLQNYLKYKGISTILKQYGINGFCKLIREIELSDNPGEKDLRRINTMISRLRKKINEAIEFDMQLEAIPGSSLTCAELYNELKESVFKE